MSFLLTGTAYTLLTSKDSSFAVDLVQNLNISKQTVTPDLQALAQSDPKYNKIKHFSSNLGGGSSKSGGNFGGHFGGNYANKTIPGGIGFVSAAHSNTSLSSVSGGKGNSGSGCGGGVSSSTQLKAATSLMLAQESKQRGMY